jgi:UDP-N-acetyl-alpha-D-muramoyl-L-alanyl-L-glutamate epimerase
MTEYKDFIFESYDFNESKRELRLCYSFDDELHFTETYVFDFDFMRYDAEQLDRALQNLFFMAGVSYFKAYPSTGIKIKSGMLDDTAAAFFARTYQRGLGEFYYVNRLDPRSLIPFTANAATIEPVHTATQSGLLVGLGGGKDSLVSVELLRREPRVATWSLGHAAQLAPLVKAIGLPHYVVRRVIDPILLDHNANGARNGHVPISAILACTGTVVGILAGYSQQVVSNENSANEPTLTYQATEINHQYSKSLAFETDYQSLLKEHFGAALEYFSLLRPLSELQIAELFAAHDFVTYRSVFSSCNRAFTQDSQSMSWCGECAKCAFVCLMLTPFSNRAELARLWDGKNLLLDPGLEPMYRRLLGIEGDKPLDCVGEIKESRVAMRLAQQQYPELARYEFDVPDEYDYRKLSAHSMPEQYFSLLKTRLLPEQPE